MIHENGIAIRIWCSINNTTNYKLELGDFQKKLIY